MNVASVEIKWYCLVELLVFYLTIFSCIAYGLACDTKQKTTHTHTYIQLKRKGFSDYFWIVMNDSSFPWKIRLTISFYEIQLGRKISGLLKKIAHVRTLNIIRTFDYIMRKYCLKGNSSLFLRFAKTFIWGLEFAVQNEHSIIDYFSCILKPVSVR